MGAGAGWSDEVAVTQANVIGVGGRGGRTGEGRSVQGKWYLLFICFVNVLYVAVHRILLQAVFFLKELRP